MKGGVAISSSKGVHIHIQKKAPRAARAISKQEARELARIELRGLRKFVLYIENFFVWVEKHELSMSRFFFYMDAIPFPELNND